MFCGIGKFVKGIFRSKHRDRSHVKFRVGLGVLHHFLIGDNEPILVIFTNRMANHSFPHHRAQAVLRLPPVLYRWNDFFDMTNTNHHTPDILYKRHLFCVGNAEGLPFRHISVKIIEDSFLVFRILYPHGTKIQNWFPLWLVVNLIGVLPFFNIFPHEPCKRTGRKTISGVDDLRREEMPVRVRTAFLIGMNRCLYYLPGRHESCPFRDTWQSIHMIGHTLATDGSLGFVIPVLSNSF